jgi:hypothetical protein
MPLSDDELKSILIKLDDVMRQAQEMSAQIKIRLNDRRSPDNPATNRADRRSHPEQRKRSRG